MESFAAFLSYSFVTAFTPGPNNIMALSCAGAYGLRKGFRFCFGVCLGMLGVLSACAALGAVLFRLLPEVEPVMRGIGAAYLLWLAWSVFRSEAGEAEERPAGGILTGMLLQFVNPKFILYGITAFSSFVLPYDDSAPTLSCAVAGLAVIGFSGSCCWAMFGAVFQRFFREHHTLAGSLMALSLVGCAASLYL